MNPDSIKNEDLRYKMQLLYGTVNISQLASDLGKFARQDGEQPVPLPVKEWNPLDQSLVRRWLTGERPVPRWADVAIADMLATRVYMIAINIKSDFANTFAFDPEWVERLHVGVYPWGNPNPQPKFDTIDEMEAWLAEAKATPARAQEGRE